MMVDDLANINQSRTSLFDKLLGIGQQNPIIYACLAHHFRDGLSQDDTLWLMIQTLHQDRKRLLSALQDCQANRPVTYILHK